MTLGPVMLDIEGCELTDEDRRRLTHPQTGGIVLFSRNYRNPDQLADLCREIHALRDPPLVIAVDHEGGRVQRFRSPLTRLPPAACFGQLYRATPDRAMWAVEQAGWLMAGELCGGTALLRGICSTRSIRWN